MTIAIACTAIFGALLFGLGLWISVQRLLTSDYYIGAGDPAAFVTKLSRAHGNTAEFVPLLALLMICLAMRGAPAWVEAAMIAATVSRLLVVFGFLTSATLTRMNPAKAVGAVGTYLAGLVLTVALLFPG